MGSSRAAKGSRGTRVRRSAKKSTRKSARRGRATEGAWVSDNERRFDARDRRLDSPDERIETF